MIGIRREDKSTWEARVPLTPEDVRVLTDEEGLTFHVQTSPIRVFPDDAYRHVGAAVVDHLDECPIILGVKEMPVAFFEPRKTYVFFSHTIKAQPANMPMLRRLVELDCTLIDYERIVDDQNRRLVFFGRYAGLAGMIDTLWALGQRLAHDGIESPFALVRRAYEYEDLASAKREIAAVGESLREQGVPEVLRPFICGFAGYGNVSQGAQEIYDLLPTEALAPDALGQADSALKTCGKVVFREEHLVQPRAAGAAGFDLQDYYDHPEKYATTFFDKLRHLSVLVNCIYWEPKYPRLVTCDQLRELFGSASNPRLRVIGDITCDIEGSIECTVRPTEPGDPVYVYEPLTGQVHNGIAGHGPVILAVDILPCELPRDASTHFGEAMRPFMPALARADFSKPLSESGLPPELQRATIVYRGELTPPYRYLQPKIS
jgi:alpha-aminoadipic semialdehyde synthase